MKRILAGFYRVFLHTIVGPSDPARLGARETGELTFGEKSWIYVITLVN